MIVNLKNGISDFYEQTDTLVRYYNDIRGYKVLTPQEEKDAFILLKDGNEKEKKEARDMIIQSNQRFVVAMAKKYSTNDKSYLLDLIDVGNEGLIEAIDLFNVEKGVKFTSFAVWYVRRAINNFKISYGEIVKKTNISKTKHLMSQIKRKFIQKEHRSPTPEEIKDILSKEYGVVLNNTSDVFDLKSVSITSSFGDKDDDEDVELMDYTRASMQHNAYNREIDIDWAKNIVTRLLSKIPKREAVILQMSFGIGYDREYELEEIAQTLGLSNERIRQLRIMALDRLQKRYKSSL